MSREHLLPSGLMHVVVRLTTSPLRLLNHDGRESLVLRGGGVVGGARSRYYIREFEEPTASVGAVLQPGAARPLLGVDADVLTERHTPLCDLIGATAGQLYERLCEETAPERRLDSFENFLMARLPRVHGMHPAVALALSNAHTLPRVDELVRASAISHRHFANNFRHAVGLPPKTYLRVLRFQQALRSLRSSRRAPLAAIAAQLGYSDQAHFSREFVDLAGVTPGEYGRRMPDQANHLPAAR
jgi:AraC-like DNA-binding protein